MLNVWLLTSTWELFVDGEVNLQMQLDFKQ